MSVVYHLRCSNYLLYPAYQRTYTSSLFLDIVSLALVSCCYLRTGMEDVIAFTLRSFIPLSKTSNLFIFQDPNYWTRDNIISADKVLFIVPGKPEAESITPIRNQWIIALNYLSGHHFTIRQVTRKVAVVMLPSSGNIPCEVRNGTQ